VIINTKRRDAFFIIKNLLCAIIHYTAYLVTC
jgi:hypothetical protein